MKRAVRVSIGCFIALVFTVVFTLIYPLLRLLDWLEDVQDPPWSLREEIRDLWRDGYRA